MASSSGPSKKASEMRIILMGNQNSGKSSSGNTVLGSEQFSSERTDQCEKKQGDVEGRHVTVVDTPGWFHNASLNEAPELVKQEIVLSPSLCPPGPHAVLLNMKAGTSHKADYYKSVEDHMELLGPTVWSHAMILFNRVDLLGGNSIEQYIESEGEGLQRLLEKCGNRYHVFNNENRGYHTQVTELLQKIEEMGGDKGGCFEIDRAVLEETEKKRRSQDEGATRRQMKVKKERESIRSRKGDDLHLSEMGIILLGYKASGRKSSSGNTVLGLEQFSSGETDQCEKRQGDVAERHLTVINTPGWYINTSLNRTSELIKQQIVLSASLCPSGPHALLLVLPADASLTADKCKNIEDHVQLLGPTVWSHTMILFTLVGLLRGRSIEHFIESEGEGLQRLVEKCGNRYHVLDSKNRGDGTQVTELLQKIEEMVAGNGGRLYGTGSPATPTPDKSEVEKLAALLQKVTQDQMDQADKLEKMHQRQMEDSVKGAATSATPQHPTQIITGAEDKLSSVRKKFIQRVSDPVLNVLLDELLDEKIITDEEMYTAMVEKLTQNKARNIIDMVRKKGNKASSFMIGIINKLDCNLSEELQLKPPATN